MRSGLSILLALLVLLQSGSGVWRVAGYKLNQDYIARVLCINRDKPQLKCNGKCHLRKQLKQDQQQQKQQLEHESGAMLLFCQAFYGWLPARAYREPAVRFPHLRLARQQAPTFAIFSPPWSLAVS